MLNINCAIYLNFSYLISLDAPLEDITIKELNMVYARALLYEFSLNNRDGLFINKIIEVIGKLSILQFFDFADLYLFYFLDNWHDSSNKSLKKCFVKRLLSKY